MTGHLLIHVGLPKTATTTLQAQYFPSLNSRGWRYLGTLQPRDQPQDPVFLRLRDAVMKDCGELEQVNGELRELLAIGTNLVVSEEMFLVSGSDGFSWRNKMARLSTLLSGLDYTILVSVREPVSGSFSYYVELEPRYRTLGLDYLSAVKFDDAMQIFDYRKLLDVLDGFFPRERVRFARFDDLVAGRLGTVGSLFGEEAGTLAAPLAPMNMKSVNSVGAVLTGRKKTAADLVRESALIKSIRHRLGRGKAFLLLRAFLRRFDAITLSERAVTPPTPEEKAQVAALLLPGWRTLQQRVPSDA